MVPDLAHVGFTPATPLPNQGFPARFLAKTDALDAAVLAHFADAIRPEVRPLRDAES